MLDAKSAFDVVKHSSLIRKLFHMGLTPQEILMIDDLYKNASVRQGDTLSGDLYKVYVNDLLNEICNTGFGGNIGTINCSAPTCADDLTITSNSQFEAQILVNIANDYSKKESYIKQPTKSVILPIQTNTNTHNDVTLLMDEREMPTVDKTTHIGIQRSNFCITTSDPKIVQKLPPRVKIVTGYILQSQRAKYNSNVVDLTCQLCQKGEETISHILLTCDTLEYVIKPILERIVLTASRIFSENHRVNNIELLRLICDPYNYCINNNDQIWDNVSKILEPQCRK
ncbi:unnamed protein product [Mytilus coruscus]|uniref:Reverse transcriptase domain-containing protein n=1 Tax=Mytilus coruscus TaxID=42192 RepID=A0A6J7ZQW2_MYTCO|nr:unnamed protein product [Mytilus coruscus]